MGKNATQEAPKKGEKKQNKLIDTLLGSAKKDKKQKKNKNQESDLDNSLTTDQTDLESIGESSNTPVNGLENDTIIEDKAKVARQPARLEESENNGTANVEKIERTRGDAGTVEKEVEIIEDLDTQGNRDIQEKISESEVAMEDIWEPNENLSEAISAKNEILSLLIADNEIQGDIKKKIAKRLNKIEEAILNIHTSEIYYKSKAKTLENITLKQQEAKPTKTTIKYTNNKKIKTK